MVQHLKHVPCFSSLCFGCLLSPWSIPPEIFQSCHPFSNNSFCCAFDFPGVLLQFCLCLCMYLCYNVQAEVRGQYMRVSSFLPLWAQTRVIKLGSQHLYPLSHLASPDFLLLLLFCILMFSAFLFLEQFSVIHPQFSSGLLSQRQFCPYDEVGHVQGP